MDSKEKLILKKFKHFLAQNNALHQYRINTYNNYHNKICNWEYYLQPLRKLHIDDGTILIRGAFTWAKTPQGHEYWSVLDKKWRQILHNK